MAINIKGFLVAIEHDAESVWDAIKGSPQVATVETVAVDAVATALETAVTVYVPAPFSAAIDSAIAALAKQIVSEIPSPAAAPAAPTAPAAPAGGQQPTP